MPAQPISDDLYELAARDAHGECGYCRAPQRALPYRLEIEHLRSSSLGEGDQYENLWLSCHKCSLCKAARQRARDPQTGKLVSLYNPRIDDWAEHFTFTKRWRLIGRSTIGRATIEASRMNRAAVIAIRSELAQLGRFPPAVE